MTKEEYIQQLASEFKASGLGKEQALEYAKEKYNQQLTAQVEAREKGRLSYDEQF